MAATVYSGSGNWSYTNSTGENVRVIIGIALANDTAQTNDVGIKLRFGAAGSGYHFEETSGTNDRFVGFGKHITSSGQMTRAVASNGGIFVDEFWLANGHTANLDAVSGSYPIKWYNVVVIPE